MTEDQPLTDLGVPDTALAVPVPIRSTETDREHLEHYLAITGLRHWKLDLFQDARAGEADSRRRGRAQDAASTAGRTVSMSFSMVSRS
jgi:hypothetical protein